MRILSRAVYITLGKLNAILQTDLAGTFDVEASQSFENHNKNNETNWWHISCKIDCLSRKTKNLMKETSQPFLCIERAEKQEVTQSCCEVETSLVRFPVKLQEQFTPCKICARAKRHKMICNFHNAISSIQKLVRLAQVVEQWTGNPEVGDSSPCLTI